MSACPRCRGGLYRNEYAAVVCLCCGWVEPPPDPLPLIRDRNAHRAIPVRERLC